MKISEKSLFYFKTLLSSWLLLLNSAFAQFEDMPHHAQFLEKQKVECSKSPSKKWDSERNACITLQEAKDRRDKIRSCGDESKYPTEEARKKCYDDVAQEETGVGMGEGDKGGMGMLAVSSATAALSAIMMFSSKSLKSSCTSRNIFAGTSAVGLAAEFFYIRSAKKKLEELQEAYKKETASGDEYHSQKRAFEFLKEEQLAIKDFEEKRRNALYVMTAGYAAAGVWAVVEGKGRMGAPCDGDGEGEKNTEDQNKEVAQDGRGDQTPGKDPREGQPVGGSAQNGPAADGRGTNTPGKDPKAAVGDKVAAAAGINLNTPMTIAISSGVAGGFSMMLASAAAKQVKRSEDNVAIIQEIIDQFEADFGQFCPQGRDDLKDPQCYCYNLDGTENSKRSNSNICLDLWAKNKKSLFAAAGTYDQAKTKRERRGCAFINGQFDEDCRCRQMKNPQGQNACLKVGVPGGMLGQIGQMNTLPTAIGNLNNMAQGGLGTGEFNSQNLSKNAQALSGNARRALEQAYAEQTGGKDLPSTEQMMQAGLSRVPARVLQDLAASSPGAAMMAAEGRPQNEALKAAMEKAKISVEDLDGVAYSPAKRLATGKNKAGNQDQFFDDWGSADQGSQGGDILNFMEKNYEYKGNDIVERDDVSLWQIISNRYTQSGLRRLFGEEGEL